jgi:hypothetical protein
MLNYSRQIVICGSIRETIKQALMKSGQLSTKLKTGSIFSTDSILRAVSLFPRINNGEELKEFIAKRIASDLRLTESEREKIGPTI